MTAAVSTESLDELPLSEWTRIEVARFRARHPEWWVLGIALAAWCALVAPIAASGWHASAMHSRMPGMADHVASSSGGTLHPTNAFAAGSRAWLLMVVAMMLPMLVPRARRVAASSIGRIRNRAIAQTLAGELLVWLAVGVIVVGVIVVGVTTMAPAADAGRVPIVFVAAWVPVTVWQFTPVKRRALRACHFVRVPPGLTDGRQRVRAGAVHAEWCAVSCGPAMATMALTAHSLLLMAVLTGGFTMEVVAHRPDVAARGLAAAVIGAALVSAALATVG